MGDHAIRVDGLSKAYQLRHNQTRNNYRTLREDLVALAKKPLRRGGSGSTRETFWALDDVSFDVKHGEALGIIGRNGAGKSTLLKILSRITKPTRGTATVYGRVGSLLEVGTGFHPELTGRENIFLNGAILGMTKRDIQRHFDEIVAFAEVEQFLDTPVKRYSSGMYMRLAFAVAAHLEPEVLVVDEVLAVGDAAFQKKCLGKMSEVAEGGRTVLFVSHNMAAITRLCTNAILMSRGKLINYDTAIKVVSQYQSSDIFSSAFREFNADSTDYASKPVRPLRVECVGPNGAPSESFYHNDPIVLKVRYQVTAEKPVSPVFRLFNQDNAIVFTAFDFDESPYVTPKKPGIYESELSVPPLLLNEGTYSVLLSINADIPLVSQVYVPDAVIFQVVEDMNATGLRKYHAGPIPGVIRPELQWTTHGPL
ncbi:MAG: ABC transporter ATP-binding protein [Anaerolineae bacterium]